MSRTMRAAVLVAPGRFETREVPVPDPAPGRVRVRLEGCGVCASNLPPWEGREWFTYPFEPGRLGHEGWGVVDALGEGAGDSSGGGVAVGDRVCLLSNHAYAEYDVADEAMVIPLRPELAATGQPFPGEPLGCAFNIFRRAEIRPGATVAVVGVGFLGAILTRLAWREGARVIAVARRPFAQEVARRMGATDVLPMDDHYKIIEQVKELTGGDFCPVVVEAVGKQWPLDLAGELTGVGGRLVVAGYHQDGPRQVNMQLWNWRGLDVINAHERDAKVSVSGVRAAMQAVSDGTLDPAPLYTHAYPLERLGDALDATRDRPDGFLKALITLDGAAGAAA